MLKRMVAWIRGRTSRLRRSSPFVHRVQAKDYRFNSGDPSKPHDNIHGKDLQFHGWILIEVENIWNDERTRGTRFDGEIVNRLAIYEKCKGKKVKPFIGEQCRYNPRALLLLPFQKGDLPFISLVRDFDSFDETVAWIAAGEMIESSGLRSVFEKDVARCRSTAGGLSAV